MKEVENLNDGKIYNIDIKEIRGDGKLSIQIKEGAVVDQSGLKSDNKDIETGIVIDNIVPIGKFKEVKIEEGKVNGEISLNENIRKIEGWDFKDSKKIHK